MSESAGEGVVGTRSCSNRARALGTGARSAATGTGNVGGTGGTSRDRSGNACKVKVEHEGPTAGGAGGGRGRFCWVCPSAGLSWGSSQEPPAAPPGPARAPVPAGNQAWRAVREAAGDPFSRCPGPLTHPDLHVPGSTCALYFKIHKRGENST